MEFLSNHPKIILDGAHNIHGVKALVDSVKEFKFNKIKVVFSALNDKAFDQMINMLDEITDQYYFTSMLDLRATDPIKFTEFTSKNYILIEDYKKCIDEAINNLNLDETLLITGSLHFISMVREYYYNK